MIRLVSGQFEIESRGKIKTRNLIKKFTDPCQKKCWITHVAFYGLCHHPLSSTTTHQ